MIMNAVATQWRNPYYENLQVETRTDTLYLIPLLVIRTSEVLYYMYRYVCLLTRYHGDIWIINK